MKIKFRQPHLSIRELKETSLPKFTLITGQNGAGKTHLLQAIQKGSIEVDIAPDHAKDIRYFDWTNLIPSEGEAFNSLTLIQEREGLITRLETAKRKLLSEITGAARNLGLSGPILSDPLRIMRLTSEDVRPFFSDENRASEVVSRIEKVASVAETQLVAAKELRSYRIGLERLAKMQNKRVIELSRIDIEEAGASSWNESEIFQNSLSRIFVSYRDQKLHNLIKRVQVVEGESNVSALTDEDFEKKYLPPPWRMLNDTLARHGLDFEVTSPNPYQNVPFIAALKKRSTGTEVRFAELSSGEKALVSLTLCAYYAQDQRYAARPPRVLLLDEVDATLHPSMTRQLVDIVLETLIGTYGIEVIATTHSPSTVALSPEAAIHVMEGGQSGVVKTSKAAALSVLTEGVPTLSISYDGRRQVFAESATDAELYDEIFQILKPKLGSERSLQFIPTGVKSMSSGSDVNTGCGIVRALVKSLSDAGNTSAFGLVDWDGHNRSAGRVFVLGEGRRNGLENVILDPLLVASMVMRNARMHVHLLGLKDDLSYADFLHLHPSQLQMIADRVQAQIRMNGQGASARVTCAYVGGFSLEISQSYLQMDDHRLEQAVLEAFPGLKQLVKNRQNALMRQIVSNVVRDRPEFLPMEFQEAFSALLTCEAI
jgi:energy-coupling factor transporter ATP-binding protein EcfA2